MHECFWIRGEKQGLGGECESGKMNWKLARNVLGFGARTKGKGENVNLEK